MKSFITTATLLAFIPHALSLMVQTPPNVVQCQPVKFVWSDGQAPYYLTLIPGGQLSAPPLKQFPPQQGTSLTWKADLQANTIFTIVINDARGQPAYSNIVTIQPSTDSSCLNTSVLDDGSGGMPATSTASQGSASTTGSSAKPSGTSGGKKSAAGRLDSVNALGMAGFVGLLGAALV